MTMQHDHYHDITAREPLEMGMALGQAFGPALGPFLTNLPELPALLSRYLDDCLSLTQQHFPDIVAEMEGYAAGAGVEFARLWLMMLEDDIDALPGWKAPQKPEKCTSIVTNNARLAAHNEDWNAAAKDRLFILRRSLGGNTMLELHYAGTPGGNAVSISSNGVIQLINSLPAEEVDISIPRIPANIIARHLAGADDITAAFDDIRGLPRMGGYAHTILSAAPDGPHIAAEISQSGMAITELVQLPYVHANHFVLNGMDGFNRGQGARTQSSRARYAAACNGAAARMSPNEAMQLLEDKSQGPENSLMNGDTIAGVVIDLEDACAWIRLASEAEKNWLRYELDFLP